MKTDWFLMIFASMVCAHMVSCAMDKLLLHHTYKLFTKDTTEQKEEKESPEGLQTREFSRIRS
jgi:hypothetical protein